MNDNRVFSCSVTYEASDEQLANVGHQLLTVANLQASVIYDNSTSLEARQRISAFCRSSGIAHLGGEGNSGTGEALNALLRRADATGHSWMFYFDQDSMLLGNYAGALSTCLNVGQSMPAVVAIGSRILLRGEADQRSSDAEHLIPVRFLIASGTVFNVPMALNLGGFDADMFLDTVDHEFCLRARRARMSLLQDNARVIGHEIGSESVLVSKHFGLRVSRHPDWRRELMWRNAIILVRRYFRSFPAECLRHVLGRTVDTLLCALIYRDTDFLTSAARGVVGGLRSKSIDPLPSPLVDGT